MNRIKDIVVIFLFYSCTSSDNDNSYAEIVPQPIKLDTSVFYKMNPTDSQQLITTWKKFINDLETAKEMSFDTVDCWSVKDAKNGDYSSFLGPISIDTCIIKHLLPLKNTSIWPVLKSNDYTVEMLKREDEQVKYYIIFPRCETEEEIQNTFKHYFYFQNVGHKLMFKGYSYNL